MIVLLSGGIGFGAPLQSLAAPCETSTLLHRGQPAPCDGLQVTAWSLTQCAEAKAARERCAEARAADAAKYERDRLIAKTAADAHLARVTAHKDAEIERVVRERDAARQDRDATNAELTRPWYASPLLWFAVGAVTGIAIGAIAVSALR